MLTMRFARKHNALVPAARFQVPVAFCLCVVLLWTTRAKAAKPGTSDPQALSVAQQSVQALTGGMTITDATLTGTVTRIAGSDHDTGTAALRLRAFGESRLDFKLSSGTRSEIRDVSTGTPQGAWNGPDGVAHTMAFSNCWTDSSWAFPALSYLAQLSNSNIVLSYVGQETRRGITVHHLRAAYANRGKDVLRLSATDYYIDSSSLLPLDITYAAHPDDDSTRDIAIEVRLADYRSVNGAKVPFRIQQLMNGSLLLDITLTSAAVNTGVPLTTFQVQ